MAKGKLKTVDSKCIVQNWTKLKAELDASEIVDLLMEREVITFEERIQVTDCSTREKRNETFLRLILNSGPYEAFDIFLQSLKNKYQHIYDLLKTTRQELETSTAAKSTKDNVHKDVDELDYLDKTANGLQISINDLTTLKTEIDAADFVDVLMEKEVFTVEERMEVTDCSTRQERNETFFNFLLGKGSCDAISIFVQSIKNKNPQIYRLLIKTSKDLDTPTNDESKMDKPTAANVQLGENEPTIVDSLLPVPNKIRFPKLNIIIIGKTGNGKSSTGNTILGKTKFHTSSNSEAITKEIQFDYCERDGRTIKVVDTPGFDDTDHMDDPEMAAKTLINKMHEAITLHGNEGYHAFLFVIKFGERFRKEDANIVDALRNIFGYEIIRSYCIMVITYGDNYKRNDETMHKDFNAWCLEQEGKILELFQECNHRIILFDNNTKDDDVKRKQVSELIETVLKIQDSEKVYAEPQFKNAEDSRLKYMASQMTEKVMSECSIILQKLQELDDKSEMKDFDCLINRANNLFTDLKNMVEKTSILKQAEVLAMHALESIETKKETIYQIKKEMDNVEIKKIQHKERQHSLDIEFFETKQEIEKEKEKNNQSIAKLREDYEKQKENLINEAKLDKERKEQELDELRNQLLEANTKNKFEDEKYQNREQELLKQIADKNYELDKKSLLEEERDNIKKQVDHLNEELLTTKQKLNKENDKKVRHLKMMLEKKTLELDEQIIKSQNELEKLKEETDKNVKIKEEELKIQFEMKEQKLNMKHKEEAEKLQLEFCIKLEDMEKLQLELIEKYKRDEMVIMKEYNQLINNFLQNGRIKNKEINYLNDKWESLKEFKELLKNDSELNNPALDELKSNLDKIAKKEYTIKDKCLIL